MSKYYHEEIEKDTRYREEYLQGVYAFLNKEKENAIEKRKAFISPKQFKENPEKYRQELKEMLGFPLTKEREMPTVEKTFVVRDGNVDIFRMQFTFSFGVKSYGLYFQQIHATPKTPFLFVFHGGEGTPEMIASMHLDSANYNHLARRITDRGASVFCPQLLLWKPEMYGNTFERGRIDGKLRQLGGSVTALEIYLQQCMLDYFEQNETVNIDHLGVAGLSYGGMYTMHFTALEPRVKSAYSCSWLHDSFTLGQPDWCYKNAQYTFTSAEVAGLVAPRPFVVAMGDKDELFSAKSTKEEYEKALPYYEEFDAANNFKCVVFDGVHETDTQEIELDFLFENLQ